MFKLGANNFASLLGHGFQEPSEVVRDKIELQQQEITDEMSQMLMDHGTRFEPVVRALCERRHDVKIMETGLKVHPTHDFITASPDGCVVLPDGRKYLTEFKVRQQLSKDIPMKYWIQMQVQMEVWGIPECLYCENVIHVYPDMATYERATADIAPGTHGILYEDPVTGEAATFYWALKDFRECTVRRNTEWWSSVIDKICGFWSIIESGRRTVHTRSVTTRQQQRIERKRKHDQDESDVPCHEEEREETAKRLRYINEKEETELIQPYQLGNYFRKDPLLDWLNLYGPHEKRDPHANPFLSMMRYKNIEFNARMISHIEDMYPGSTFNVSRDLVSDYADIDLDPGRPRVTFEHLNNTEAAMARKVPIVFNACFRVSLPSYPYAFGGRADMIILNAYLEEFLGVFPGELEVDHAPEAYSVINFRYATINLRADRTHLLNNSKQRVYKAHMWLLNSALGVQQECVMNRGFILGRKYDFTKKGIKYKINNALKGFGVIDFSEIDRSYEEDCREALTWLQRVREEPAAEWDPFNPGKITELYPNMKNASDHPWHGYKGEIAQNIKDVTLMYHCGPAVRDYAHEKGITDWTALTADSISYCSGKLQDQIVNFIKINTEDRKAESGYTQEQIDDISLKGFVHKVPCVEFYLDFEAIGNLYDDFSTFPEAGDKSMIFLVGVVVVDHVRKTKEYHSYLAESLTHAAERNMINRMLADFKDTVREHGQDFVPLYFWSNAENYMLKRAVGDDVVAREGLVMIDLCKCYKGAGLILPGQMGYGLKEVATVMHNAGLIQTTWKRDVDGDIDNGLSAAIGAMRLYNSMKEEDRKRFFKAMIDYNYVDCKVMEEIVEYIRTAAVSEASAGPKSEPSPVALPVGSSAVAPQ